MADPSSFRAQFPVFERVSYLNAGTEGPVPARATAGAHEQLDRELTEGRCGKLYMERVIDDAARLRAAYASVLGCAESSVALTGSTTDGVNTVLGGLDLREGDEILTSDEEHPGLLAPLGRARRVHRVRIKVVPFDEIAGEVSAATRLVACSHVSWMSGRVVDTAALASAGAPVLLDAAQAVGAIPVDVQALGCDYYAASGQKWLCGQEGSGCLFVAPQRLDELVVPWPGYGSLADAERALEFEPKEGAARLDHGFPPSLRSVWALAALEVFAEAGWDWVHDRAVTLADQLERQLTEAGNKVVERGRSTLVCWKSADPQADVERLAEQRIVIRSIPAHGLLRASVGAWSSEEELERLVAAFA